MLRSEEEQCGIIASFAGWLKISPLRLQFKSITQKADSAKYIAALKKELDAEPNEACRELGSDYIRLISEVGNREALTRRFFLIFTYENAGGIAEDPGRIYGELMAAEQNARAYLALCGNSVVQPKDEDEAAALSVQGPGCLWGRASLSGGYDRAGDDIADGDTAGGDTAGDDTAEGPGSRRTREDKSKKRKSEMENKWPKAEKIKS